ncbi:MAG: flagellar export chaperone FliS [Clostridia bacterium]
MAMNNPYAAYQRFATVKVAQTNKDHSEKTQKKEIVQQPAENTLIPVRSYQSSGANQYQENTILSAKPEELTLMLYDGAIKFMNQAIIYIQVKDIQKSHNAIIRIQDIFSELMSTLKMEYEVSKGLYSLYDFINNSLMDANLKKDQNIIREMISLTRDLRETWAQAMKIVKKG